MQSEKQTIPEPTKEVVEDKVQTNEQPTAELTKEPATTEPTTACHQPGNEGPAPTNSPAANTESPTTTETPEKKDESNEGTNKVDGDEEEHLKQEPKRRTAYNYFVSAMQPQVKKENPALSRQGMS
jgi:hypothetical protein